MDGTAACPAPRALLRRAAGGWLAGALLAACISSSGPGASDEDVAIASDGLDASSQPSSEAHGPGTEDTPGATPEAGPDGVPGPDGAELEPDATTGPEPETRGGSQDTGGEELEDGVGSEDGGGDGSDGGEDGGGGPSDEPCESDEDCLAELQPIAACKAPFCADGVCALVDLPSGAECEDGNPCTSGDFCSAGACAGAPLDCEDGNPCTADACSAANPEGVPKCVHIGIEAPCDDGDPCSEEDHCQDGDCVAGELVCPCGGPADCEAFEDGDPCNGQLTCSEPGFCVVDPDTLVVCPDPGESGPCESFGCNPDSGTCTTMPLFDGTPCDDGDP